MSKSIWHKLPSQPEEDRLIVVKSKRTGEYLVGNEFEFILDNFTKWAYFDDLLALETKLKHTRKALDVAVDALKLLEKELYFNNAKQTGHIADSVMSIPSIALEQITLEQKD